MAKGVFKFFAWTVGLCALVVVGVVGFGAYLIANSGSDLPWNHPTNNITSNATAKTNQSKTDVNGKSTKKTSSATVSYKLVAPVNAKCEIIGSNGVGKWVSGNEWNDFVKAHPDYVLGTANGQYIAEAPNLAQNNTGTLYFICQDGNGTRPVAYGTYLAAKNRLLKPGSGYVEIHHSNYYALIAPWTVAWFSDGYSYKNVPK